MTKEEFKLIIDYYICEKLEFEDITPETNKEEYNKLAQAFEEGALCAYLWLEVESTDEKLEKCRNFISSWAWLGFNGSPFTEEQAIRLQTRISNDAWSFYEKTFGKKP